MNPWHKLPFLRLFLPFLPGILLGGMGYACGKWGIICLISLIICQIILVIFHKGLLPYSFRWVPGVLIGVYFFMAGLRIGYQAYEPYASDYFGKYIKDESPKNWIVTIEGPLHEKEKSIRTTAIVSYFIDNLNIIKTTGRIHLIFKKEATVTNLSRGDCILVKGILRKISGPGYPFTFDYAAFSARKGILYQLYVKREDWNTIKKHKTFSVRQIAWECQQKLVGIIREQSLGKDEQAVGCAMLLGYTEGFGQDLQGAYSRAGVTHILSVSGLHVGLVFLIFNRLLFFLNRNQGQKLIKTILLVILTWMYAFLTGLAPCVQRAAFMFSLLIIGQSLGRKNNITNTLFASAFILVWINPANIGDYGFQLSYLAVLGIVWLEPILYNALYINISWIDKLWKLTAVTLAAQLATGPLASLHFHQFPVWFIPANLIVIPLSTLVMYLGIGLLVLSSVPLLGYLLKNLFGYSILLMNQLIQTTDRLPYPVIEGLYPSLTNTAGCYLVIFCAAAWLLSSRKAWLFLTLFGILFYSISLSFNTINKSEEKQLAVFNSGNSALLALQQQQCLYIMADHKAVIDSNSLKIKLKSWLLRNKIRKICWMNDSLLLRTAGPLIAGQEKILWVNGKKSQDYLNNQIINIKNMILSGKLTRRDQHQWKNFAQKKGMQVTILRSEGCYLKTW